MSWKIKRDSHINKDEDRVANPLYSFRFLSFVSSHDHECDKSTGPLNGCKDRLTRFKVKAEF